VADHRHAVVRDLNFAGYHGDKPITVGDFVSIVIASPPGSAVRYAAEGGWSQTDHLIANLAEQQAHLTHLPQRYMRPGIEDEVDPGPIQADGSPRLTPQTREEFEARRARDRARAAELAATEREVK
jgi:hypothetical protein